MRLFGWQEGESLRTRDGASASPIDADMARKHEGKFSSFVGVAWHFEGLKMSGFAKDKPAAFDQRPEEVIA